MRIITVETLRKTRIIAQEAGADPDRLWVIRWGDGEKYFSPEEARKACLNGKYPKEGRVLAVDGEFWSVSTSGRMRKLPPPTARKLGEINCPDCGGNGDIDLYYDGSYWEVCPRCGGTGKITGPVPEPPETAVFWGPVVALQSAKEYGETHAAEAVVAQSPSCAYKYARDVAKRPIESLKWAILRRNAQDIALAWAEAFGRDSDIESRLAGYYAVQYAIRVAKRPTPNSWDAVSGNPRLAYLHAKAFGGNPYLRSEASRSPTYSLRYAVYVDKRASHHTWCGVKYTKFKCLYARRLMWWVSHMGFIAWVLSSVVLTIVMGDKVDALVLSAEIGLGVGLITPRKASLAEVAQALDEETFRRLKEK